MTRIILRTLNPLFLIVLVLIGVAAQTSLFASWPLQYLQPDFVLIVVVWCALQRGFIEGGILTLIISSIAEIHSAAPSGLYMVSYMLVFLGVRVTSKFLVIPNYTYYALTTAFASIFWKLTGLGTLYLLGASANQWKHTMVLLFPGAVVQGMLSYWVYQWLERFDWITYKNAKAEQALENELQLDNEGF